MFARGFYDVLAEVDGQKRRRGMMRIRILTIVPEAFGSFLETAVIRKAVQRGRLEIEVVDMREFAGGSFRKIDDSPYGGGTGMVLRVDTVARAIRAVSGKGERVVLMSPRGRKYNQKMAREFVDGKDLVLVCGHYEGVDERVRDFVDEEVSLGDFVLTGGELAAQVVVDSVARLLPGVLRAGAAEEESFEAGLLEYPQYTHPAEFEGRSVPMVLLSGDSAKIRQWRLKEAIIETIHNRPEMLAEGVFEKEAVEVGENSGNGNLVERKPKVLVGRSRAKIIFFEGFVLKIRPSDTEAEREVVAMRWLKGKLPVPEVIYHEVHDGISYLLMSRLKGKMLCDQRILGNRRRLLKTCAAALKMLWAVDLDGCPFVSGIGEVSDFGKELVLSHGDFCLPNILCDNDGVCGFLDWGNCHIGRRESDIEDCLKSLNDNLVGKYAVLAPDGMGNGVVADERREVKLEELISLL